MAVATLSAWEIQMIVRCDGVAENTVRATRTVNHSSTSAGAVP